MSFQVWAFDGPVACGKGAVTTALAVKTGGICLESGLIYRAIAKWMAFDAKMEPDDSRLDEMISKADIIYKRDGMLINGVTYAVSDLRTPEVGKVVALYAKKPVIRKNAEKVQRAVEAECKENGFVLLAEGRDMSKKFPDAKYKFFLTADVNVRAERRFNDFKIKGHKISFDEVLADTIKRDKEDMERPLDPLRATEESIIIDSSSPEMNVDKVVETILKITGFNGA